MADKMTPEQRHKCMSSIKSRGTSLELMVRKYLFAHGFRYRVNDSRLPGHPDIVLKRYQTVIFVNGCFWHGHENCANYRKPQSNVAFWETKIQRNRDRDAEQYVKLRDMGWHVIQIWECQLKKAGRERTLQSLAFTLNHIFLRDLKTKCYQETPAESPSDMMVAEDSPPPYRKKS